MNNDFTWVGNNIDQREVSTMSKVLIQPSTYENARAAVDRAFELFPLQLENKKILIKPNVLRASEAKEGIVYSSRRCLVLW